MTIEQHEVERSAYETAEDESARIERERDELQDACNARDGIIERLTAELWDQRQRLAELKACARDARNGKSDLEKMLAASVLVAMLLGDES